VVSPILGSVLRRINIALIPAMVSGCLYDSATRCDSHQSVEDDVCVCDEGFALVDGFCVACGVNEVASSEGCECEPGFARADSDDECAPLSGIGEECEEDLDCTNPEFALCERTGSTNYCTSACVSSEQCPGEFSCRPTAMGGFCERPPTGLGTACMDDECDGFEASYCETVVSQSCVVNDCKVDPERCHGDWVCCDIGLLSESLCIPPGDLEDGKCPAGGTLIAREVAK
jgi:hypothetical protein